MVQDIRTFKDPQHPQYPTEKNYNLLDLIIKTSSNENSIVLDCFCGSGTTLLAAQNNGRRWIGIDQSLEAIKVANSRLSDSEKIQLLHFKISSKMDGLRITNSSESVHQVK